MKKFIAFLRGVNVGGSKVIKMKDLAEIFTSFGFKNVKTFIQSGNVIFESSQTDIEKVKIKIEKGLKKSLGYSVDVVLRTPEEMLNIIKANPFKKEITEPNIKLYVMFLSQQPDNKIKQAVKSYDNELETFRIKNCEVYVLIRKNDIQKTVFSTNFLEKKLGLIGTTRNWNSVNKILQLTNY